MNDMNDIRIIILDLNRLSPATPTGFDNIIDHRHPDFGPVVPCSGVEIANILNIYIAISLEIGVAIVIVIVIAIAAESMEIILRHHVHPSLHPSIHHPIRLANE